MEEENKKRRGVFDKLILGAIIGGAIGSVLGLTLAPKTGKDTRKFLKRKGEELHNKIITEYGDDIENFTQKAKEGSKNFLGRIGKRISNLFEKREKVLHGSRGKKETLELPDEFDL